MAEARVLERVGQVVELEPGPAAVAVEPLGPAVEDFEPEAVGVAEQQVPVGPEVAA